MTIDIFIALFKEVLDRHAPSKKKMIRGNQAPFMNKTLSKAFMTRARLRNKYYKNSTSENKLAYTKQKNFCINLLERERKKYYNELDITIFENNKTFWDRVKPLFSEKIVLKHNLCLKEDDELIKDKKKVAEILNNYFMESVENLEVERYMPTIVIEDNENDNEDDIDNMIKKFQNHPSILKIKENVSLEVGFKFRDVTVEETFKKIISLDPSKACMKDDIPTKVLLGTGDIVSSSLTTIFNNGKNNGTYPGPLKTADVTPLPKGREKNDKKKYRPVSLTPILSKVFEKHMYEQIAEYAGQFLSPYLFGYRKGHSTE